MSRADELLAQYQKKIAKVGQWVAVRRFAGIGGERTYVDILTKGYLTHLPAKEFVGAVVQYNRVAIVLAAPLNSLLPPLNNNDKLMIGFSGFDNISTTPPLNEDGHVQSPKENAIFSVQRRDPGGKNIVFEIRMVA